MRASEIFRWLDSHPWSYWSIAFTASIALIITAWRPLVVKQGARPSQPWIYPLLLLGALLAWRWPYLFCANELNTDESQFIAGALTLGQDPLFWRSVDGMTAGPLVYYLLTLPTLLGLPLDFFVARLTGLLAIWLSLCFVYRLLHQHYGEKVARLGLMPATLFVASAWSDDLNHYSSELVSLPLIAGAVLLLAGRNTDTPPSRGRCLAGGFLIGWLPWAKLQAGPIGAVLALAGVLILLLTPALPPREKRIRSSVFIFGILIPSLLVLPLLYISGVWQEFYQSYIAQNIYYAEIKPSGRGILASYLKKDPTSLGLLVHSMLPVATALLVSPLTRRTPRLFFIAAALLLAAIFCVILPQRDFLHYTMLLLVPLAMLAGTTLGELQAASRHKSLRVAEGLLVLGSLTIILLRSTAPLPPMIGQLEAHWRQPLDEPSRIISLMAQRGEQMAVWGWYAQTYASNGLRQATREAYSYWSITDNPQRDLRRKQFLADFVGNRPEVFLDSVGPNAIFFQDRVNAAHEIFPALAAHVREHYTLVIDLGYARIYGRRDLVAQRNVTPEKIQNALEFSRPYHWLAKTRWPVDLGAQIGAHYWIDGQVALLLLPPSQATWTLRGDEREFQFECGYHPASLAQSEGNGTQFLVELVAPDGTHRPLLSFLLDPANHPTDRQKQTKQVILPPFEAGSKLVVRTEAGFDNYNAWDWAYIARASFLRSPVFTYRQFPGFNRTPDAAFSPLSGYLGINNRRILILHAPAQLTYTLNEHEQRLRFSFGFAEGAYALGGQTNGAMFMVALHKPDGTKQTLFSRTLQPVSTPKDRGLQHANISLPPHEKGTQLLLIIDPAGSNAFDWTYFTDVDLN